MRYRTLFVITLLSMISISTIQAQGIKTRYIAGGLRAFVNDSLDFRKKFGDRILIANFSPVELNNPSAEVNVMVLHKMSERDSSFSENTKALSGELVSYLKTQDIFGKYHRFVIQIARYGFTAFAPQSAPRNIERYEYYD